MNEMPRLFVTPDSLTLTDSEKRLLQRSDVGGVVLFGINIGSRDETRRLNDSIHDIRDDLVVATDEEGGIVSRLYHLMPSHSQPYVASLSDADAYEYYRQRAHAMRELGFDLNLAPVVDIAPNRESIMYKRTYGSMAEAAIHFASICIHAQREEGLASCIKHFPGIGNSSVDSHLDVPEIGDTETAWQQTDGRVYAELTDAAPEFVMVGHVRYPKIDPTVASGSEYWITKASALLPRSKILIDDVTMKGFDETTDATDLVKYGAYGILVKDKQHPYVTGKGNE